MRHIEQKSNAALLRMLCENTQDYLPEALEFAHAEANRRGISGIDKQTLQRFAEQEAKTDAEKAQQMAQSVQTMSGDHSNKIRNALGLIVGGLAVFLTSGSGKAAAAAAAFFGYLVGAGIAYPIEFSKRSRKAKSIIAWIVGTILFLGTLTIWATILALAGKRQMEAERRKNEDIKAWQTVQQADKNVTEKARSGQLAETAPGKRLTELAQKAFQSLSPAEFERVQYIGSKRPTELTPDEASEKSTLWNKAIAALSSQERTEIEDLTKMLMQAEIGGQ